MERFNSRVEDFDFRDQLERFTNENLLELSKDVVTLMNLNVSISNFNDDLFSVFNELSNSEDVVQDTTPSNEDPPLSDENQTELPGVEADCQNNSPTSSPCRLEGKFVSKNVVNLSKRQLDEISLLSKGSKFIPTPSSINKAKLKENLEVLGRKLRLK